MEQKNLRHITGISNPQGEVKTTRGRIALIPFFLGVGRTEEAFDIIDKLLDQNK